MFFPGQRSVSNLGMTTVSTKCNVACRYNIKNYTKVRVLQTPSPPPQPLLMNYNTTYYYVLLYKVLTVVHDA
jgi:hypothetical protein